MKSVDDLINDIIAKEGETYTNDPDDRGGPTKYGITQATLSDYVGKVVTPGDVERLTRKQAEDIYRDKYYAAPGIAKLPKEIQPMIMDWGVNSHPHKAIMCMQEVVAKLSGAPIKTDGAIGPRTIAACAIAINVYGAKELIRLLVDRRLAMYEHTIQANPSDEKYRKGWEARARSFLI